jgi:acyl phosphate:glycerol-3-phosphate acyltransferase
VLFNILAVIIGYVLGSIPSAYVVTRLLTGKDVRTLGGGNVGGLNVYREVGLLPAVAVIIADLSKGAAAVAVAYWWLGVTEPYVLAAAVAAVVGHNWMLFLKFTGGKGMGPAVGVLALLFFIFGYPLGLGIFILIICTGTAITRNVALSMAFALVSLPFIAWLGMHSLLFIIFSLVLGSVILVKFLPTARLAVSRAGNIRDFIFDRWQRNHHRSNRL